MLHTRRALIAGACALPLCGLGARPLRAEPTAVCAPDGRAIEGYDPVAYFMAGAAQPGSGENALRWRGAIWLFASDGDLEQFEMNPHAFAPRYGGYCVLAMARGTLVAGDPQAWAVVGGRLYLAHSAADLATWQRDVAGNLRMADSNWPAILTVAAN